MTEENKKEVSTEVETNEEATKVELSEEEMDGVNGGFGVNMAVWLRGNGGRSGGGSNSSSSNSGPIVRKVPNIIPRTGPAPMRDAAPVYVSPQVGSGHEGYPD